MPIRNRILEYGIAPAEEFTGHPFNPHIHPQFQREMMDAALKKTGWLAPVIVNKRTGYLIDGHERVMQALIDNDPVPYVLVDLSEVEEAEALATFDYLGGLSYYDHAQVQALIAQIDVENSALERLLIQMQTNTDVPDDATQNDDPTVDLPLVCPCCGATIK